MRTDGDFRDVDNRSLDEIVAYQDDRIQALLKRNAELEAEVARLRRNAMNAHLGAVAAA